MSKDISIEWLMDDYPEVALFLLEKFSGFRINIPKCLAQDISIFLSISKYKKSGYTEDNIEKALVCDFELTNRNARQKIKEFKKSFKKYPFLEK